MIFVGCTSSLPSFCSHRYYLTPTLRRYSSSFLEGFLWLCFQCNSYHNHFSWWKSRLFPVTCKFFYLFLCWFQSFSYLCPRNHEWLWPKGRIFVGTNMKRCASVLKNIILQEQMDNLNTQQTVSREWPILLALAIKAGERLSVLERARRLGPVLSLVPGFSFDSDSKIKLYEWWRDTCLTQTSLHSWPQMTMTVWRAT